MLILADEAELESSVVVMTHGSPGQQF